MLNVDAQTSAQKEAYPLHVKQLHSGHSLTDPLFHPWPGQYVTLLYEHLGAPFDNIQKSTTPGSPMQWRWEHEAEYGQPDARLDIADWELLVITESVPLGFTNHGKWLSLFAENAWEKGNNGEGTPTMLWTTWTHIDDAAENDPEYAGPFRQLLDEYEPIWEAMADSAMANLPEDAPPVFLIPGHRMMARLYDDIESGLVPGISNINQFFSDNIHPNSYGAYAIAMVHYACIFNADPKGLPNNLGEEALPTDLADYIQTMVWEVVNGYERTGISSTSGSAKMLNENGIRVYPNPTSDILVVDYPESGILEPHYKLYDASGGLIMRGRGAMLDLQELPGGSYVLESNGSIARVLKR